MLNVISVRLPYLENINEIMQEYGHQRIKGDVRRFPIIFLRVWSFFYFAYNTKCKSKSIYY